MLLNHHKRIYLWRVSLMVKRYVTKIGVLSLGKIMGIIYAILGLIFGAIMTLFSLALGPMMYVREQGCCSGPEPS
jgi:hypothetical protein